MKSLTDVIAAVLGSSVFGGGIVALINYRANKKKKSAEAQDQIAETAAAFAEHITKSAQEAIQQLDYERKKYDEFVRKTRVEMDELHEELATLRDHMRVYIAFAESKPDEFFIFKRTHEGRR